MHIRKINPHSEDEIKLVAGRMRQTLMEVLGQERGESMYTMEWLRERVLWHLSPQQEAAIFIAEDHASKNVGQAIVRVETDKDNRLFSYFSTIYVDPEYRGQGVATRLIKKVINWSHHRQLPYIIYNTAENNKRLIELFGKFDFQIEVRESEMVQLKKRTNHGSERPY